MLQDLLTTHEKWMPVPGFQSRYSISNLGRVKSLCRGKETFIKGRMQSRGYMQLVLADKKASQWIYLHRLVAELFIGPPPSPVHEVNHLDGDKLNNAASNLEWATHPGNIKHAVDSGFFLRGIDSPHSKQVVDVATGKVYDCMTDAAKAVGLLRSTLSMQLTGKRKNKTTLKLLKPIAKPIAMIQLPNGCHCSDLSVTPKNWNTKRAPVTREWVISYRFYDPIHRDKYPKGKQRKIRVSSEAKTLEQKQEEVRFLMSYELNELQNKGFNLITLQYVAPVTTVGAVLPETLFLPALREALALFKGVPNTVRDLRSMLKYVEKAVFFTRLDCMMIKDVSRRHVKMIMEALPKVKTYWSANTYNFYRSHLSMLFSELIEAEAIETNPCAKIKKQKHTPAQKKVLTPEECQMVDEFARQVDERLWMFIHIFFHSGARESEMVRLQGENVDLQKQVVKYQVLKGRSYKWVDRPIKDIALPLWQMAMQDCGPKDYVFSRGLKPGPKGISASQINRRWKRHIKDKLGIEADFYSLKHLNTTQVVEALGEIAAAKMNGHTSTRMVEKVYDIKGKQRKDDVVRGLENKFAG